MSLNVRLKADGPIPLDLGFEVKSGEVLALVGPSGSGKTTVLRSIAGLWTPQTALITCNNQVWEDTANDVTVPNHKRRVGMVLQSYALFPHMTAAANVVAALGHLPKSERRTEADRLLALVGLSDEARRYPAELSGGQQQRVALARAIARQPDVLLLDEPFSAVDRPTRERLYAQITELRSLLPMPVVFVTHDMDEAQRLADRLAVIDKGTLVAEGGASEVAIDPRAMRVLGLRETGAVLNARVDVQEEDGLTKLTHPAGDLFVPTINETIGTEVKLRLMAHDVMIASNKPTDLSALNILPARVVSITQGDGPGCLVHLDAGGEVLYARVTRRSANALDLHEGKACFAVLKSLAIARNRVHR